MRRTDALDRRLAALLGIGCLCIGGGAVAACGDGTFPDTSGAPPLRPPVTQVTDAQIASAAGLRALEFATNFQRRSANLIGQNPLIVAEAADGATGGSASADGGLGDARVNVITTAIAGTGDESVSELGSTVAWDTAAAALGIDYRLARRWSIGAMLARSAVSGCSEPDDDFEISGSVNVRSNAVEGDFDLLSVYSYFDAERFYVDGIASTGSGEFDFRRSQTVNGLLSSSDRLILERVNETVVANADAALNRISVAAGIKRRLGPLSLSPFGRLAWASVQIERYRETLDPATSADHPAPDAGGGFALRISEQRVESVTTGLGVNAGIVRNTSRAVLTLQSNLEWTHEFNDRVAPLSNAYAGFSQGTVYSLALSQRLPDRTLDADYLLLGLGGSALFPRGVQLYAAAQFLLGYRDVDETALTAGVRLEF